MRNIFINNYRKEVRDQIFVDQTDNLFHLNSARELDDYVTDNDYDTKEIYRVVHSLPRDYRIPFLMHIAGFKYREIADRLGLPLGTVKSRIFFTRQQLQGLLKDYK
jgi:RNA polymerase sigma-70 factor (ECF subfamily)